MDAQEQLVKHWEELGYLTRRTETTHMNTLDLTVIIPVHSVADPNFRAYLDGALVSIKNNDIKPAKVMIVRCACDDVAKELANMDLNYEGLSVEVVENITGKSLQSQVNFGASKTTTKYFSFVEFDDEVSVKWFSNVKEYTTHYPDVSMMLPIIAEVSAEGAPLGLSNEAAWAQNFSDKQGYLDNETLMQYPNFNLSGMVVNTQDFLSAGGYKPSIKLTFNLELLLRLVEKGMKVMIVPKIGYRHTNMRPGSLFWNYKYNDSLKLMGEEAIFWMDVAKKEYFFTEDRKISYVKTTS